MAKVMNFRFDPAVGMLIEEVAEQLTSLETRPITKTEVMKNALALYHSVLTSGNIANIFRDYRDVEACYRQNLARAHGLKTLGER